MIASIIVIVLMLLLLGISMALTRTRGFSRKLGKQRGEQLRPVDIDAFRNLIDPAEEDFLRRRLPPADFRRIQRERLGAAKDYITGAARNAEILLQLAEPARLSPDPEVVQAAQKLIDEATQLRLYAFRAIPRIYFAMLFPSQGSTLIPVADGYERMTEKMISLGRQHPAGRVSIAL
jgi:hypothetical protein